MQCSCKNLHWVLNTPLQVIHILQGNKNFISREDQICKILQRNPFLPLHKNVRIRSFSGLFFWKIRTRKTSNTDTIHVVCITEVYSEPCLTFKMKRFVNIVKIFNYFYKTLHLRCLTRLWMRLCICKILTIEPQGLSEEPPLYAFCKQLNLLLYSWKILFFVYVISLSCINEMNWLVNHNYSYLIKHSVS